MTIASRRYTLKERFAYGLFWSWNLIFLAFMVLGFAPRLLPELLVEVRTGMIPAEFLVYALVLSIVPLIAVILGLTILRRAPARLFALGYVVEGPLMLMLAVRLFLIRQATPGVTLILVIAGLGMAAFMWQLLDPEMERRGRLAGILRLIGLTLMLLTSLYAAVWIAFYAIPILVEVSRWFVDTVRNLGDFLKGVIDSLRYLFGEQPSIILFSVLGFVLGLYTASLFVLAPIAVPYLAGRAWWRSLSDLARRSGRLAPALTASLTVLACAALFFVANQQPQGRAFALLENPPASAEEARALLRQQDAIRAGLLNAYLAPFRYISAEGEVGHISDIYAEVFHVEHARAYKVQQLYEGLVQPMLYEPVVYRPAPRDTSALSAEPQQAARLYQRFFDETIVEGEHQTIVNAASSTWSIDQAEAALQAVDEREVYLERQEVNVQEHGDWADVELYEVYRNRTADQQEVIYYFNLPESAAITGVWLGNSPDRERRFAYQVAPRGAAQAVYRNETRVMRDPALVEQIGPRQYRLRVYPVPPISMSWDDSGSRRTVVGEAPPLYMWLTYRALSEGEAWPLPRLAQNRNVYWDADTVRLINGAESDVPEEAWLPEAIPASGPVTRVAHRMDLPWGDSVLAVPVEAAALPALPGNLRLAVVLDRSRSMESHADQVSDALDQLREKFGDGGEVDVYLTSSAFRGEEPSRVSLDSFNPRETLYFGGQNAAQLLVQYEKLRGERAYDAVLVLTDGSGYELGESWVDVPIPDSPAWIVHLGSDIPLGYDDQTLEAIQASGGGVTGSLDQALERIAMGLSQGGVAQPADQALSDIVDGYVWSVLPAAEAPSAEAGSEAQGFGALAARRLILAEMQRQRGSLEQLGTLDRLHALAQEYSIVTPYSSMIVLVNYQQQQILEHLEQEADRYDREVEDLGDTTPATQTPLTGVPEPEEWLLMGMAVILLLWVASSRRLAWQRR